MRRWLALAMLIVAPAVAQDRPGMPIAPPPRPEVGDGPTISVEPLVARPPTRSCTVTLFERQEFVGDAARRFAYAPPVDCPGPWAKVVIETDGDVTAGRQFDRSGFIALGGVNLFTGTTMEPRRAVAPHWHAERDVSDDAAVFRLPRSGTARLTNFVDDRYTGHIHWGARLVFYQADAAHPATDAPDLVLPIGDASATVDGATPASVRDLTLPRNVERLAIDVLALPQGDDEFWYACIPDAVARGKAAATSPPCGVPFRESEVRIDDRLAGFAPIYPWIYTGGVDPALWDTVPGIETLAMAPYRVDLTPFAGLVDDGASHRIAVSVAGVHRYVILSATLRAWRDAGRAVVSGTVDRNDLAPAVVATGGAIAVVGHAPEEESVGHARVTARRDGVVSGHVDTSHGRVVTTISQVMRFRNDQRGTASGSTMRQSTGIDTHRDVTTEGGTRHDRRVEHWPLVMRVATDRDGTRRSTKTWIHQALHRDDRIGGSRPGRRIVSMTVDPASRTMVANGDVAKAERRGRSTMRVRVIDDRVGCYDRTVTVADRRVTKVRDRCR